MIYNIRASTVILYDCLCQSVSLVPPWVGVETYDKTFITETCYAGESVKATVC